MGNIRLPSNAWFDGISMRLHKKLAKPKLKAIRESRFVKVNRQLAELLPSSNGDRVWIREV
jgi:chorismate-pyruvate lyase